MSLPILQVHHEPTPIDLVRLFHRTSAMWVTHLAEGESLDAGTAYANSELAALPDANNFRDAALHDRLSAGEVVEQVESHYRQQGARCAYWVMNPSAPPAQTQPLIDHLLAGGYRRQSDDIYYLRKVALRETPVSAEFKVIPARASYRLVEQLAREAHAGPEVDRHVEAALRHLDDAHYDALLGLSGDRAVASLGVAVTNRRGVRSLDGFDPGGHADGRKAGRHGNTWHKWRAKHSSAPTRTGSQLC